MIFIKRLTYLVLSIVACSCHVTETISINEDGSGTIEVEQLRDEYSYMTLAGENYSKETKFKDTSYVFLDYISKYKGNFDKYTPVEQQLFSKFKEVQVHVKQSSFEKEFRTTLSQSFQKVEEVPDLYKTEDYADDLANNYALTAEEHYFTIQYSLTSDRFKRIVTITDQEGLKREVEKFNELKKQYVNFKVVQDYTLKYHFFRKIKSVSNNNAKISPDRKSFQIQYVLTDCLQNPEITALEVIFE
ncbi:hypothetical protein FFWV33_00290 [Flavobacterium faecale]|uniref:Uncharacterized protein n=1 Tax=Flavobacterium faecale TaxID=1355330 RepID=A0A2S1L8J9_9FLAO|nr:hypothetical protein [Flavobacterium faecale]AWG20065.1 hypothetical protein FFWV33_00290 [Flavobacterium faecale]